jgi:hypothetical protein
MTSTREAEIWERMPIPMNIRSDDKNRSRPKVTDFFSSDLPGQNKSGGRTREQMPIQTLSWTEKNQPYQKRYQLLIGSIIIREVAEWWTATGTDVHPNEQIAGTKKRPGWKGIIF